MRLLRLQNGRLSLTKFDKKIPSYAILSHTWGAAENEVTLEDVIRNRAREKKGYKKIKFCAKQAANHNLEYFWVDTCCINKADLQEFQTAINSMYRWYQNAQVCFVYMTDVAESANRMYQEATDKVCFRDSRWFTRCWTLQELLAPRTMEFYSHNHQFLGNKESLVQELEAITAIPASALLGVDSPPFTLEQCISWAKGRRSTYEEDGVYSLLGLCGVSIAPNYGEGVEEAFERLRERCQKKLNASQLVRVDKTSPSTKSSVNWYQDNQNEDTTALRTTRVLGIGWGKWSLLETGQWHRTGQDSAGKWFEEYQDEDPRQSSHDNLAHHGNPAHHDHSQQSPVTAAPASSVTDYMNNSSYISWGKWTLLETGQWRREGQDPAGIWFEEYRDKDPSQRS